MLQQQRRHIRVVTRQYQLRRLSTDRRDGAHQVFEHIDIVHANLQHHAAWHACCLITPRIEVDLAQAVTANVGFCVDQFAKHPSVDLLLDPAKLALSPALVAQGQNNAGLHGLK